MKSISNYFGRYLIISIRPEHVHIGQDGPENIISVKGMTGRDNNRRNLEKAAHYDRRHAQSLVKNRNERKKQSI